MITVTEERWNGVTVWLATCNRSGCGRPAWIAAATKGEAEADLTAEGWEVHGRRHTCPSCLAVDGIPHDVQARDAAYEAYGLAGPL